MALANRIEWQADVPHEPGQWFRFRRLSARQLQKARDLKQAESIANVVQTPGFVEALSGMRSDGASAAALRDPLDAYDRWTLVRAGVVAWSYADVDLSPDAVDELDEETLDWAARELIPKPLAEDARLDMFRRVSPVS